MTLSAPILGIDIGGTSTRAALVTAGRIARSAQRPTPQGGAPSALAATLRDLLDELGTADPAALAAAHIAGVAMPGVRDPATGVLLRAINLPLLEGTALPQYFAAALQRPVCIHSDVNAAGWAQWQALSPPPARLAYISVGTGIGGCVIVDGRLLTHTRGGPGHFGFLICDTRDDAPLGRDGIRGSAASIINHAFDMATGTPSPGRIAAAARALGVLCVQLVHLFAPQRVLLGGGVIDRNPGLVAQAAVAFAARRGGLVPADMVIEAAPIPGDAAGVLGAAALALAD